MALAKILFAAALLISYGDLENCCAAPLLQQLPTAHHLHDPFPLEQYGAAGSSISSHARQLRRIICKHTADPQVCRRELSRVRIPSFATPLDVVSLALQVAARRVNEAQLHLASNGARQGAGLSPLEEQCANDCVELLSEVREQMALASARLSQLDRRAKAAWLREQLADVKVWLSASLSYQAACSDNFEVAPGILQRQVHGSGADLAQALGVVLSLVDAVSRLGNDVALWAARPVSSSSFTRPAAAVDSVDGLFPRWVSTAQRKLLQASLSAIAADAVVAKDGSGQYSTVTAAVNAIPKSRSGRYVIYIKKGTYDEVFNLTSAQKNVTFLGDGVGRTIITGDRNVASGDYNTYRTSTVGVSASGFYARDITFRNTAGPSGHQAVALRAGADYMVFYRCSFEGYQDTLYALSSRQFYRECQIAGTVDFIFGNAIAVFQNCALSARLPMKGQANTYTAQGRQLEADISGYSFQNCTVEADPRLQNASYSVETYLGRPWKAYSRAVFMQSELRGVVDPRGWLPWNSSNPFQDTLYYGEYGNRGDGSDTSKRVTWGGVHSAMSTSEATEFTVTNFIAGQSWLGGVQVPYQATL